MSKQEKDIANFLNPGKIALPIVIGIGVALYLLLTNVDTKAFANIRWTWFSSFCIMGAFCMVVVRDLAYMIRIRVLTSNALSWRKSFDVIMIWEFASAIVPMILGGGFAFAILVLNREKISMGKSISVIMFTSFLDGMFFALFAPLIYYTIGQTALFSTIESTSIQQIAHGKELYYTFWFIYFVVLAYKLLVAYALFINAKAVKQFFIKLFSIGFLKKWRNRAEQTGDEMVMAAIELQNKNGQYWLRSFVATCVSWTARFLIINFIIAAFSSNDLDHYLLYGRQIVMGILMIGSPTPGGTGVAEIMFSNFLGEFIDNAGLTVSLAVLWRLISYYPYLFIGAIVLPRWIKRVFTKTELKNTH